MSIVGLSEDSTTFRVQPCFFLGRKKHCSKERKVEKHLKRAEALTCTVVVHGCSSYQLQGALWDVCKYIESVLPANQPAVSRLECALRSANISNHFFFLWIPIINMPENCPAWLDPRQCETHFICLLAFLPCMYGHLKCLSRHSL